MSTRIVWLLLLLGSTATTGWAAEFVIVAHPSVDVSSLSERELGGIFLRNNANWRNGTAIIPVDQTATAQVRSSFSRSVHARTPHAVVSYWRQQVFSGRKVPPVELKDDAAVIAFVKSRPGAIGYVSAAVSTREVKVVAIK